MQQLQNVFTCFFLNASKHKYWRWSAKTRVSYVHGKDTLPKKPFATFVTSWLASSVCIHMHQKWCLLLTSGHFWGDKLIQFSYFFQFYLSVIHICAMKHSHFSYFGSNWLLSLTLSDELFTAFDQQHVARHSLFLPSPFHKIRNERSATL